MNASNLKEFVTIFDPFFEAYYYGEVRRLTSPYPEQVKDIFDLFSQIALRKGKRIRPALVFYTYKMLGGKDEEVALKVGAIIELLHAHWLVIDDVFDKSDLRRGEPTAHKQVSRLVEKYNLQVSDYEHFSNSIAIVSGLMGGDFAYNLLGRLPLVDNIKAQLLENISKRMFITSGGEGLDILNSQNFDVTQKDIENMMYMKTTVYSFENPMHCGAILAGANKDVFDALSEYAKNIGIAFQIRDDLLGMFGDITKTGKSNKDDLEEGKMTLLVQYGLMHLTRGDKNRFIEILRKGNVTDDEHEEFKRLLVKCGADKYCRDVIQEKVKVCGKVLDDDILKNKDVRFLKRLIEFVGS